MSGGLNIGAVVSNSENVHPAHSADWTLAQVFCNACKALTPVDTALSDFTWHECRTCHQPVARNAVGNGFRRRQAGDPPHAAGERIATPRGTMSPVHASNDEVLIVDYGDGRYPISVRTIEPLPDDAILADGLHHPGPWRIERTRVGPHTMRRWCRPHESIAYPFRTHDAAQLAHELLNLPADIRAKWLAEFGEVLASAYPMTGDAMKAGV